MRQKYQCTVCDLVQRVHEKHAGTTPRCSRCKGMMIGPVCAKTKNTAFCSFKEQLKALGFTSYARYLKSVHWLGIKRLYRRSGRPRCCAKCKSDKYKLRHIRYDRLGSESLDDLMPMCNTCYKKLHCHLKNIEIGVLPIPVKPITDLETLPDFIVVEILMACG